MLINCINLMFLFSIEVLTTAAPFVPLPLVVVVFSIGFRDQFYTSVNLTCSV